MKARRGKEILTQTQKLQERNIPGFGLLNIGKTRENNQQKDEYYMKHMDKPSVATGSTRQIVNLALYTDVVTSSTHQNVTNILKLQRI